MPKAHIQFIELGDRLKRLLDEDYDLTNGTGLPLKGDCVFILGKQYWVVERHWNIYDDAIGYIMIYLSPTSDQARTI